MDIDLAAELAAAGDEIQRLHELDLWKNAFLAAAAHDLRAPLAVIMAAGETLQAPLSQELVSLIASRIQRQAGRLDQLLSDLLDLDRFTRGVVRVDRRPTDLDELVASVLQDLALGDERVSTDVDPDVAEIDPDRASQILANLLGNAVAHTPDGTPIRVSALVAESCVVITVEDQGPGIPGDLVDVIFDPFVSRPAHNGDGRSTGLGLTLVRLFAELHGGDVKAENGHSGGARFVVTLPVDAPPAAPSGLQRVSA